MIQARPSWIFWIAGLAAACAQAQPDAGGEAGAGQGNQTRRQTAKAGNAQAGAIQPRPACIDVSSQAARLAFTGRLGETTFTREGLAQPGERVFILALPRPICISDGGDFADPHVRFSSVQIGSADDAVSQRLRDLVGQVVTASGEGFAAHNGHHYRPLVLMVDAVSTPSAPSPAAAAAARAFDPLATVRSFYRSLGTGRYEAANSLVVPRKRAAGPLSARAMASYYSTFERPLRLIRAGMAGSNSVIAAYDYVLPGGRTCRGESVVDLERGEDGSALIGRIRTVGPC